MSLTNYTEEPNPGDDPTFVPTIYEKGTKTPMTSKDTCILKCGDD